jgi:hypothetical protein
LGARDAESGYGAFRALRALDERDEAVQGELLNDTFWLHKVAPGSAPLVHVSTGRRAEVVLFGETMQLKPPFSFLAGEFAVTAGDNDEHCILSRFAVNRPPLRRQCSLKLEDVLRTLAGLGGTYPEAVELLRQVESCDSMTCHVVSDALPQATTVHELAKAGSEIKRRERNGGELVRADGDEQLLIKRDEEVIRSRIELGATPNLFERNPARRVTAVAERDEGPAPPRQPPAPPSGSRLPPR